MDTSLREINNNDNDDDENIDNLYEDIGLENLWLEQNCTDQSELMIMIMMQITELLQNLWLEQGHFASALNESDPLILAPSVHANLMILSSLPFTFRNKIQSLF